MPRPQSSCILTLLLLLIPSHAFVVLHPDPHSRPSTLTWSPYSVANHAAERKPGCVGHDVTTLKTALHLLPDGGVSSVATSVISSLFRPDGNVPFWQALSLNAVLFGALSPKLFTMLTPTGFAHAMALGTLLWTTLGYKGWIVCVMYLFAGQLVTKVKFKEKQERGLAEGRGGRRGPENVWGSAATGLACAACSVQGPTFLGISSSLYILGYVASLATKLADTFASEIGKAYGKTTFLITTLKRVEPGTEGAVSAEGTAASVVGGLFLSLFALAIGLLGGTTTSTRIMLVTISTVSAFLATNVESLIGATLQEQEGLQWMTNEVVNFINTLVGAVFAMAAGKLLLGM